jgi:hypothetical protein
VSYDEELVRVTLISVAFRGSVRERSIWRVAQVTGVLVVACVAVALQ